MASEQITFEPEALEALNKELMKFLGKQDRNDSLSRMFTSEKRGILMSAMAAYKTGQYSVAVVHYKTCLNSIGRTNNNDEPSQTDVTLQYLMSRCLLQSDQFQDLLEACSILMDLEATVGNVYPMVYYALAEFYVKVFCFNEAEPIIAKGFNVVKSTGDIRECFLPGSNDVIPESTKNYLSEKLLSLQEQCFGWHPPDAKCFMNICATVSQNHLCGKNIFFKSPAYNGMVTLICSNSKNPCAITFHSACWRVKKEEASSVMKISDKEVLLNWECLTPNCGNDDKPSYIKKITIHKENGTVFKSIDPPPEKQSWHAQQQNSSKGAIRKQKSSSRGAPTARRVKVVSYSGNSSINNSNVNTNRVQEAPNNAAHNNSSVIQNGSNSISMSQQPAKKIVKCPEPRVETYDANLTFRLLKIMSLRDSNFNVLQENDWRPNKAHYGNEHVRHTIDNGYEPDFSGDLEHIAHIKSFIFSYFVTYIGHHGPIKNDELMTLWTDLIQHIGDCEGVVHDPNCIVDVRQFLLQSLKFVAVGDYICIPALLQGAYALAEEEIYDKIKRLMSGEELPKKVVQDNRKSISLWEETSKEEIEKPEEENPIDPFLLILNDFTDSVSDAESHVSTSNSVESNTRLPSPVNETEMQSTEKVENAEKSEIIQIETEEVENEEKFETIQIETEEVEKIQQNLSDISVEEEIKLSESLYDYNQIAQDNEQKKVEQNDEETTAEGTEDSEAKNSNQSSGTEDYSEESEAEEDEKIGVLEKVQETNQSSDKEVDERLKVNKLEMENLSKVAAHSLSTYVVKKAIEEISSLTPNEPPCLQLSERYSEDISVRCVTENESEATVDEQEDLPDDEASDEFHLAEPLDTIDEIESESGDELERDSNAANDEEDRSSAGSSTIEEVMNMYMKMNAMPQATQQPQPSPEKELIAEQAKLIKQLAQQLESTQAELDATKQDLQKLKMQMLQKSLEGQLAADNTYISCKIEATRNEYAIVAKLQNIVASTTGSYLSVDWQEWAVPLERLEKIRESLQEEYTRLVPLIIDEKSHNEMDDVRLNMLNVPSFPQRNIPDLIEIAFNMIKARLQQSVINNPIILPTLPLMQPTMRFWYQQPPYFQKSLPPSAYNMMPTVCQPVIATSVPTASRLTSQSISTATVSPSAVALSPSRSNISGDFLSREVARKVSELADASTEVTTGPTLTITTPPKKSKLVACTLPTRELSPASELKALLKELKKSASTSDLHCLPDGTPAKYLSFSLKEALSKHDKSTSACQLASPDGTVLRKHSASSDVSPASQPDHSVLKTVHSVQQESSVSKPAEIVPKEPISVQLELPVKRSEPTKVVPVESSKSDQHVSLTGQIQAIPTLLKTQDVVVTQTPPAPKKLTTQKKVLPKEVAKLTQDFTSKEVAQPAARNEPVEVTQSPMINSPNPIKKITLKETLEEEQVPLVEPRQSTPPPTLKASSCSPKSSASTSSQESASSTSTFASVPATPQKAQKPSTSTLMQVNGHGEVQKTGKSKNHSLDKLMQMLREKHPGALEYDLLWSVLTVRKNHNNALSGLYFSQIMKEADRLLLNRQKHQLVPYFSNNGPINLKSNSALITTKSERARNDSMSSTSSVSSTQRNLITKMNPWGKPQDVSWTKETPEDECIICMEPLATCTSEPTYTLKCQHTFHKQCIRSWFTQKQSCPNCRIHSTIDDEFPPLS